MRKAVKVPNESSLAAKKLRKLNGVMDRSLQSNILSTRNSILWIVFGSNIYFAPST